jgi:flagellar basal-body rod modification protein FlgD
MATDTSVGGTGTALKVDRSKLPQQVDKFTTLQTQDYIKLMVSELQNQDPLNPMDNAQMLQQVSQISAIQSNNSLTSTLNSVLLGQNLSSAGSMIGKGIVGLTDAGDDVMGIVDSASIVDGKPYLNVPDPDNEGQLLQVAMSNIKQVL